MEFLQLKFLTSSKRCPYLLPFDQAFGGTPKVARMGRKRNRFAYMPDAPYRARRRAGFPHITRRSPPGNAAAGMSQAAEGRALSARARSRLTRFPVPLEGFFGQSHQEMNVVADHLFRDSDR
jgi:hypothetical protein